jgi:hypothetical protein
MVIEIRDGESREPCGTRDTDYRTKTFSCCRCGTNGALAIEGPQHRRAQIQAAIQQGFNAPGSTLPWARFDLHPKNDVKPRWAWDDGHGTREDQSFALASDPGTLTGRKAAVRAALERAHPQYLPGHAYPAYERWGYTSMQEFMDGFDWVFPRYDRKTGTLYFNASRVDYTVVQPIVDLRTNQLFLNYYPSTSTGKKLELLPPTDTRFFGMV